MSTQQSRQHAPSPDYSIVDMAVRFCAGCEDLCLTTGADTHCEACKQYDADDLAAKKRAALTLPDPHSDEAEILCDECGDVAQRYMRHSDGVCSLEGKGGICLGCETPGKIYLNEPDDGDFMSASLRFRRYTSAELDEAAVAGLVCKECLEPGGLDEHGICNECLEHHEQTARGY